jgi:hypothetical protein
MRSLHDVHGKNAYRAGHVCLSVHMIQLENHWMDLDEIWYGHYAIGVYPEIVLACSMGQSSLYGTEPPTATAVGCTSVVHHGVT